MKIIDTFSIFPGTDRRRVRGLGESWIRKVLRFGVGVDSRCILSTKMSRLRYIAITSTAAIRQARCIA